VNLAEIYVDTVGDADVYTRRLNERFTGIKCLAQPKADRDFPIVSAASIAAKVTRDTQLRDWVFEPRLEGSVSRNVGCGYPGDFTSVPVRWEHDDDDEEGAAPGSKRTGRLAFGGLPSHLQASSGAGRHSYFRARKLQRVVQF
jgi:ribonuclease H2 subunit A